MKSPSPGELAKAARWLNELTPAELQANNLRTQYVLRIVTEGKYAYNYTRTTLFNTHCIRLLTFLLCFDQLAYGGGQRATMHAGILVDRQAARICTRRTGSSSSIIVRRSYLCFPIFSSKSREKVLCFLRATKKLILSTHSTTIG
jgi:hypothetical protein